MGILRAVIQRAVLAMFYSGQEFPLWRAVALQLIGHEHPKHILAPFEEFAEERLRRFLVASTLDQDLSMFPA